MFMGSSVDRLYEDAKRGMWDSVLDRLAADDALAAKAAAYVRPTSGWTLLHQAAFWGHDKACCVLLAAGASPAAVCHAGTRPDQAARRRSHDDLAAWLCDLADAADIQRAARQRERQHAPAATNLGTIVRDACNDGMTRLRRLSKSARTPAAPTIGKDAPTVAVLCSRRYGEAIAMRASSRVNVAYGSGVVCVPQGARYYVDARGDVLVGWHGTYDPPSDMDGAPLI
nr:ankyrin repeat [Pandoravirus massiliensis]